MYTLTKIMRFDAAHHVVGLSPDAKCGRPHGHTYTVELRLSTVDLDDVGYSHDAGITRPVKDAIDAIMDHRDLNEVLVANPTAENIAKTIYMITQFLIGWNGKLGSISEINRLLANKDDTLALSNIYAQTRNTLRYGTTVEVKVSETPTISVTYRGDDD